MTALFLVPIIGIVIGVILLVLAIRTLRAAERHLKRARELLDETDQRDK